jgi:hypothetical protein
MNNTYHLIHIMLGVSIVLLAIAASFLPLQQFASAGRISRPEPPRHAANPAGSNMTGAAANTTGGTPTANPAGSNMTGGNMTTRNTTDLSQQGISSANPAGIRDPSCTITKGERRGC